MRGLVPRDCPYLRCQSQVLGHPYFWLAINQGSHDALLRFNTLVEWLTELRKTLYLHLLVYYKGYNSRTAIWIRCIGQAAGGRSGLEPPCPLWVLYARSTWMCSPSRKFSRSQHLGIFLMEVLSRSHDWLNHWLWVISSISSAQSCGMGPKVPGM